MPPLPRLPNALRPLTILKSFFILHFTSMHLFTIASTHGPSMVPTMSVTNDWVYISSLHRHGRNIRVGDLVSFKHPLMLGQGAIKRVAGLPGDFVGVEKEGADDEDEQWAIQVPEGHCWVLGDNLPESRDSRMYGPLPLALVQGKVLARVWPPEGWGWLGNTLQKPAQ